MNRFVAVFLTLIFVSLSSQLNAKDTADVSVELKAVRVITQSDGKEIYDSAEKAKPGDTIEYTATYKNNGKEVAKDFFATIPVPEGMEYVKGSSNPKRFMASLDGKKYQYPPIKRKLKTASGKIVERDVPESNYKFIRWDLKQLAPNQTEKVSARMKISTPTPTKK